jgi:hypothetical protein
MKNRVRRPADLALGRDAGGAADAGVGVVVPRAVQRAREAREVRDRVVRVVAGSGGLDLGYADAHQDEPGRLADVERRPRHVAREAVDDGEVEVEEVAEVWWMA